MKVLVLYEDPNEAIAAVRLASNLSRIGAMLANATVNATGTELHINTGPAWEIDASAAPFETLPKPKPVQPKPRRGQRRLIFDDED